MDPFLLRDRLTRLSNTSGIPYDQLRQRWQVIEDLPPETRCQINPLELKATLGMGDEELYEFFLKLVQVELLIPRWCLVDLHSGFFIKTWRDFASIFTEKEFSPFTAEVVPIDLNRNLEVCYQVVPGLYADEVHPYDDYKSYVAFNRSSRFQPTEEAEALWGESALRFFQVYNSFEVGKIPLEVETGQVYRIVCPEAQGLVTLKVSAPPQQGSFLGKMVLYRESKTAVIPGMGRPVQSLEVELTEEGFKPKTLTCRPGRVEIWVQSNLKRKAGVLVYLIDPHRLQSYTGSPPPPLQSFLAARSLVSSRSYREYNVLAHGGSDRAFPVNDLTILFAEMEPNFELYEREGDQKAYTLIQEMLSALEDLVTLTNGVVVKTLGTLIMAIFHNPEEGALACEKIMDKIHRHNARNPAEKHLLIKAAMHYGDVLAVKAEKVVDYFGKVITTAIRLQAQAEGMELLATPELRKALGDKYVLQENGWEVKEDSCEIQAGMRVPILRCRRSPQQALGLTGVPSGSS